jgi:tetratricopeptide repeat protein 30
MTGQNESAEAIMKTVEKNEEQQQLVLEMDDNSKPTYHTCLVNLVIGTLYCEKGNFEFGIDRICQSLEPLEQNLCPDTWFYAKHCLLALAGKVSKLMCVMEDDMFRDVVGFLNDVERHGKTVTVADTEELQANDAFGFSQGSEPVTVAFEARQLKHLFQLVVA